MAAMIKRDSAQNCEQAQRPFVHIVRGCQTRVIQKHEPFGLMLQNLLMQCKGIVVTHSIDTQSLQTFSRPDLF